MGKCKEMQDEMEMREAWVWLIFCSPMDGHQNNKQNFY